MPVQKQLPRSCPDTIGIDQAIAAVESSPEGSFLISSQALLKLGLGKRMASLAPLPQVRNIGANFCLTITAAIGGVSVEGRMIARALRAARPFLLAGQAYQSHAQYYGKLACLLNETVFDLLPGPEQDQYLNRVEHLCRQMEEEVEAGNSALQAAEDAFLRSISDSLLVQGQKSHQVLAA